MTETPESASGSRLPFTITVEPRIEDPPKWYSPMLSVVAVVFALGSNLYRPERGEFGF